MDVSAALKRWLGRAPVLVNSFRPVKAITADEADFHDFLRPRRHALALEPRIMFDGAAAAASDQHAQAAADHASDSASSGNAGNSGEGKPQAAAAKASDPRPFGAALVQALQGASGNASPTVTLSSGGSDVLLGDQFTVTASFTNGSSQAGFAPFIDLLVPVTGRDGDDGVSFVSATFEGQDIRTYVLTFDANGQAEHPLAEDSSGQPLILHAADYGLRAGDQLVVLQLPNASIVSGQPAVDIQVTLQLSGLADSSLSDPAPDLTLQARAGFQFGNTSANDPTVDPSLISSAIQDFVVHPTVVDLSQMVDAPDGQTATGPNHSRSIVVTSTAAPGQTLSNVVIDQDLPDDIKVTSIVAGTGGTVTSITLQDGRVITDAGDIASTLAAGAYLSHYSVTYATMTGSVDTRVLFYVPEFDAHGAAVLDPNTGAPRTVTVAAPQASADWTPLDRRDAPLPGEVISGSGIALSFSAQSIVVYKQTQVTNDVGTPGPTPGDTLTYTLEVDLSDYFAFGRNVLNEGKLIIFDVPSDGQNVIPGSGTFVVTIHGVTMTMQMMPTGVRNADGSTSLALDLAQTLRDNGQAMAALIGDLAFDDVIDGATQAVITYQTTITQNYLGGSQQDIKEGDVIGNNATVEGTVLQDRFNTGAEASDSDGATATVPTRQVDITVLTVNGGAAPANVELHPSDVVTFQLSYDLVTGDYDDFNLSAYLPLPLFDVSGIDWTQGTGVNQWYTGPGHTPVDMVQGVVGVLDGNLIRFDFGDHSSPLQQGARLEVRFTMVVSDTPFGDNRKVTVIAQSDQLTSAGKHLISQDAAVISSIAEPVLSISHGVVSSSQGSVAGAGSNGWAAPGDTTSAPFTAPLTDIGDVDGDVSDIDGGDLLRMATAIENSGGGAAYDVSTRIDLPANLAFAGGSLAGTLRVFRGDGILLQAGVDYSVNDNMVTFLDPTPGSASLLAGRPGSAADTSGQNLVVLLYDVKLADDVEASSTLQSTAVLTNYASVNDGEDFTPVDLMDVAGQQVAAPGISKTFADGSLDDGDSSASQTTGNALVVGESMLYDIVVTLPEGRTSDLRIDDLVPPGLALDISFNGGQGWQIITLAGAAGSGALAADFVGTLSVGMTQGIGGTAGQDGVDGRMSFTTSANDADNDTGNNSFVIRVRLVASNSAGNQAGRTLGNSAQITFSDPDGDVAGGQAVDRTVSLSGGTPDVIVREPTLTIAQSQTNDGSSLGVDEGNQVNYTVTIGNGTGATDFDAYDISFSEAFPTAFLAGFTGLDVSYSNGAVNHGTGLGFEIVGGVLKTVDGADIDIAKGGSITIKFTATVTSQAVNVQTIDSTASVRWTSLDGAAPVTSAGGERTGADGTLNGGTLNDYRREVTTNVKVLSGVQLSRIGGLADTPPANGGTDGPTENVAVGEIVRYRVVSAVGQGTTDDYQLQVTLDKGLAFINDGTVRIAFVSNGGLGSTLVLNSNGTLNVVGDRDSAIAKPIDPSLAGPAPDATLIGARFTLATDAQGRTVVTFHLGDITNADDDANLEGVVIEFNASVANIQGNAAGSVLDATASFIQAGGAVGASDSANETVVEPRFGGMVKQVDNVANPTGTTEFPVVGKYGTLYVRSGGAAHYVVNNANPDVQALRIAGQALSETFTYSLADRADAPAPDPAVLTILIQGANDTPVGVDDTASAVEAGGVGNTTPGSLATGNVLVNDTDVDSTGNGETRQVTGVRSELESEAGDLGQVPAGGSTAIQGDYGSLTIHADGSFSYEVDNANSVVQALRAGQALADVFSYQVTDAGGLKDLALLSITINGADDAPVAADDTSTAVEAGGIDNQTLGTNPSGSVFDANNDFDPDTGETALLSVTAIRTGQESGSGMAGTVGTQLVGLFGTLTIKPDGSYSYVVDNGNAAVQALRQSSNTLTDYFTYTASDPAGLSDDAQLAITVRGANDNPIGVDDGGVAIEAGGVGNGTAGSNATGNVLTNDTDVDQNGETKSVSAFGLAGGGAGTVAARFASAYGWLTLNADGSYTYEVNNDNATVQALLPGQTLSETFNYTLMDAAGATAAAQLTITIQGRDDTPVAVDDTATAMEAGGTTNAAPGTNPKGNVLANDTDVDNLDPRRLDGIRAGAEADGGTFASVGAPQPVSIVGRFGTLTVRADGTYDYVVDNNAVLVERMRGGNQDSLTDTFSYRAVDLAGQADVAQLVVTINGAWDAPVGVDDSNDASAGTLRDPSLGVPAQANVLSNDTDVDVPDGKAVTGIGSGKEADNPVLTAVPGAVSVRGVYGTLTINPDGSYNYKVDTLNLDVQRLKPGEFVDEYFTYQLSDQGGLVDRAQLHIEVHGINNPPFGVPDEGRAVEAGGLDNATPGTNPNGNVLGNDIDLDGDELQVVGIRAGYEAEAGTAGSVGRVLQGRWGRLTIQANGDWSYQVDNDLPEVQALRVTGQTLAESFTYTVADPLGETDTAVLRIVVDGRNDTPQAGDDAGQAAEAGGLNNNIPGSDSVGNVLDNDVDVDSAANGETKQVVSYASAAGAVGNAGSTIIGLYGSLVINGDGSWRYVVDNTNATVQALRTAQDTLSESFGYLMRDAEGTSSQAVLVIVVRGANDDPLAQDDSSVATDQARPSGSGNVLPNDSDIDKGDVLRVTSIRTGGETGAGMPGQVDGPLAGRYGTLVIHADGSYTYTIDMSNPQVLAASGFGRVLQDVFTYAMSDLAGAVDTAQLTIWLDISAPRVDCDPDVRPLARADLHRHAFDLAFTPGIFVQPVVRMSASQELVRSSSSDGTKFSTVDPRWNQFEFSRAAIGEERGVSNGEFVRQAVEESQSRAQLDLDRLLGRHGRVSVSADGLLSDPSLFALPDGGANAGVQRLRPQTANGFSEQLKLAARRVSPSNN